MDVTADLDAPVEPAAMYRWVADLERYPQWLEIVTRAVAAEAHPDDAGPAWFVQLRGKIGPLSGAPVDARRARVDRPGQIRPVRTGISVPRAA